MRVEVVSKEPKPKRKPTRKDLLIIVGRCQNLFGAVSGVSHNDRGLNRQAQLQAISEAGFQLCLDARSYEDDPGSEGPWADPELRDRDWESAG